MPLPFILGGLAVAAVATGAKKGYDGYQDKSKADDIIEQAKIDYEHHKDNLEKSNQHAEKDWKRLVGSI